MDNDVRARLAEMREREQAATKGPWGYDGMHDEITCEAADANEPYWLLVAESVATPKDYEAKVDVFGHYYNPNLAFIAHSRTDMPLLVAAVTVLYEEVARIARIEDGQLYFTQEQTEGALREAERLLLEGEHD